MKIISILLFASVIFTNCTNPETKLKVNKVKTIENTIKDTIQKVVFLKPNEHFLFCHSCLWKLRKTLQCIDNRKSKKAYALCSSRTFLKPCSG